MASRKVLCASNGTPMAVMLLEASSSRMIATPGGLGISMLSMGFGTFALYSFGLTCQLPASMPADLSPRVGCATGLSPIQAAAAVGA